MNTPSEGQYVDNVTVKLVAGVDAGITRPRLVPLSHFPSDYRVEFPRRERERFPLGTRFRITVKVCQKHKDGVAHGQPYLRACEGTVEVIASSISDPGWFAIHNPQYSDCRSYIYKLLA